VAAPTPPVDWYAVLGVAPDAAEGDLRAAWRGLARALHPDAHGADPTVASRFQLAREAFERLSDPAARAAHDAARRHFAEAVAPLPRGLVERVFGARGPEAGRGEDWRCTLTLPASAAVTGAERAVSLPGQVRCARCDGTGLAAADRPVLCGGCGGRCFEVRRPVLRVQGEPCQRCDAVGWVPDIGCAGCAGRGHVTGERTVEVRIPPGLQAGDVVRVAGAGGAGRGGAPPGDLRVVVAFSGEGLEVSGDDWTAPIRVPFWVAVAGGLREFGTPWGPRLVQIPAGTREGALLRLAGLGVGRRGDGYLRVVLAWPEALTGSEADALRAWGEGVEGREAGRRESL
jgi:molecular chaperone DnaJ